MFNIAAHCSVPSVGARGVQLRFEQEWHPGVLVQLRATQHRHNQGTKRCSLIFLLSPKTLLLYWRSLILIPLPTAHNHVVCANYVQQGEEGWDIEFFPRCIKGLLGKRIFQVEASTGMAGALTGASQILLLLLLFLLLLLLLV
jgi:hypothetical protein